ncbi:MAG: MerR family transcriptional regulator [Beijerinckiaceae bacterium]
MIDNKAPDAFRTISEAAEDLDLPQHVLRFWETRFTQIKPLKRGGGRRYYRPDDLDFLRGLKHLLHDQRYTIKGVQKIIKESGVKTVMRAWKAEGETIAAPLSAAKAPVASKALVAPATPMQPMRVLPVDADARSRLEAALEELLVCKRILGQLQAA